MTSPNSQDVSVGPPRKRQRLSPPTPPSTSSNTTTTSKQVAKINDTIKQTVMSDTGFQPEREAQVGILHFVNSENLGFTGTLKQRYVDVFFSSVFFFGDEIMFRLFKFLICISFGWHWEAWTCLSWKHAP